jgi:hypothetical protein
MSMLFYLRPTWTWKKRLSFNKIKIAQKFTKQNKEKSRYRFILGQLYEELGKKDSDLQLWVGKYESKIGKENTLFKHKLEKRSCLTIKMGYDRLC